MLQDADTTDIYLISRTWADLVKRARSKQLAPDEYNSGNFTISNMGMFGADVFDAILPPGNSDMRASHLADNAAFCNQEACCVSSHHAAEAAAKPAAGTTAILAVGGSKPTVTADAAGRIGVEKQMKVNLTADHRIVYGAQAAEFMLTLKEVIENPEQLTF